MSSTRQTVIRAPSLTGFGKRPSLMPAHQVDLLTGIGPRGAMIEERRTKPAPGSSAKLVIIRIHPFKMDTVLEHPACHLSLKGQKLHGVSFCPRRGTCKFWRCAPSRRF